MEQLDPEKKKVVLLTLHLDLLLFSPHCFTRVPVDTVAKRKVSALDSSAQLAFLGRNLVYSFDFLVAEQFFNWMGTANLLQQSSTISKNQ